MNTTPIRWETHTDHARFYLGERELGCYTWADNFSAPFFHPLWTPNSPHPVTLLAPIDHPWHRGLWWSWKYVNNLNFWDPHERENEAGGFGESRVVHHSIQSQGQGAVIEQELELREVGSQAVLAKETRRLTLHPTLPLNQSSVGFQAWAIDFDLRWTSETDLRFHTTPWPEKSWGGYGGLCFRPARSLGWQETIQNSEGATGKSEFHGQPARWAAYSGGGDGDPQARPWNARRFGVAIFDHPTNLRHPQAFYTHLLGEDSEFFSVLKAAPLMREPLLLPAQQTLRLRYRVALFDDHNQTAERQRLFDDAFDVWSAS